MHNPHYEGFGEDGSSYTFTAKTARQELTNMGQIKLNEITGAVIQPDKSKTDITAMRGLFNHPAGMLDLFEQIDVVSQNGLKAKLTRATIVTKENLITSDEPVFIEFPSGNIRAKNMRLRQKARESDIRRHGRGRAHAAGSCSRCRGARWQRIEPLRAVERAP